MEIKHMALKKYALSDVCTIVPGFAFKPKFKRIMQQE